ncbi:MAG: hypothetical protein NT002_11090 [candidate division Zixibacteria bacterium]|nr:hypothetical protein [candidate division Zixibacteria bacterium]
MPISRKQLLTSHYFQLHRVLKLLSPYSPARCLPPFFNELHHGYSGNKSKTHSDLTELSQNLLRPKNVRQKKNKPISADPSQSPQSMLRQKLIGKNQELKRDEKIEKAKPIIIIFMEFRQLRCL